MTVDDLIVTNLTDVSARIISKFINYVISINVRFIPQNISLNNYITNINLGIISSNSEEEIIKNLRRLNNIHESIRISIRNITTKSAEVLFYQSNGSPYSVHSSYNNYRNKNINYTETITVNFFARKIDLSTFLNNDLGEISDDSSLTIIKQFIRKNKISGLTININDFLVINVYNNSARIIPRNNDFIGFVNIKFRIINRQYYPRRRRLQEIEDIRTNMGIFQHCDEEKIWSYKENKVF